MYIYEEPYGLAFANQASDWELHLTGFVRAPRATGTAQDSGIAAYWETRNEAATAAYALQSRLSVSATDRRAWIGAIYKRWIEDASLLLLAELDGGVQTFVDAPNSDAVFLAVGYLGATYFVRQGVMLGAALQTFDDDLLLRASGRHAAELNLQWLPVAHVELHLLTRAETVGLDFGEPNLLAALQLHYYL